MKSGLSQILQPVAMDVELVFWPAIAVAEEI
jgi:hypothetical protein